MYKNGTYRCFGASKDLLSMWNLKLINLKRRNMRARETEKWSAILPLTMSWKVYHNSSHVSMFKTLILQFCTNYGALETSKQL